MIVARYVRGRCPGVLMSEAWRLSDGRKQRRSDQAETEETSQLWVGEIEVGPDDAAWPQGRRQEVPGGLIHSVVPVCRRVWTHNKRVSLEEEMRFLLANRPGHLNDHPALTKAGI